MVFWGKCYHSQQILVKNIAEKRIILTVPGGDHIYRPYLSIYPCERVKKEKWEKKSVQPLPKYVYMWPGLVETLPHNCIQL